MNPSNALAHAFDSPDYTLNRNAGDIIGGVATPSVPRWTFSANQPGTCGIHEHRRVVPGTCVPATTDIQLVVVATGATTATRNVGLSKYFSNAYTVNRGDGTAVVPVTGNIVKTYAQSGTYTITLSLASGAQRWTFGSAGPLVGQQSTTASNVYMSRMPALSFFGTHATNVGDGYFYGFNYRGSLTSLPT